MDKDDVPDDLALMLWISSSYDCIRAMEAMGAPARPRVARANKLGRQIDRAPVEFVYALSDSLAATGLSDWARLVDDRRYTSPENRAVSEHLGQNCAHPLSPEAELAKGSGTSGAPPPGWGDDVELSEIPE